jgi:hypothetical protein
MNKKEALEYILDAEYESVPKEFYKDKSFVLEAVKQNGQALYYVDESLKKDKSFVLEVVKQNRQALFFVDESLQKDPDIIQAAKKR